MKTINTKHGYLLFAMTALIFSVMGFAGLLDLGGDAVHSRYFGALFLSAGVFFLVCFFKSK
jgi:hypothetical protein